MASAGDHIFEPISGEDSLELLAMTIRGDVPRSACIHNMILMHAKGYTNSYDAYIQKECPLNIMLVEKSDNGIIAVYCRQSNENELMDALNKTTLIAWNTFNCALYTPESICDKLSELIAKRSGADVFIKDSEFYLFKPEEFTMELEVPADFTLRKIGISSAIQMEKVAEPLFVCPNISKYRELHIATPNCTVYHTKGEPDKVLNLGENDLPEAVENGIALAWACTNREGQLGLVCANEGAISKFTETEEELERMEEVLTHLVINACSLQMVKQDFTVHSNIYHGLSKVPLMPNWQHVGYIRSIYTSSSRNSTDDLAGSNDDLEQTFEDDSKETCEEEKGESEEETKEETDEHYLEGTDEEEQKETDLEEGGAAQKEDSNDK